MAEFEQMSDYGDKVMLRHDTISHNVDDLPTALGAQGCPFPVPVTEQLPQCVVELVVIQMQRSMQIIFLDQNS